MAKLHSDLSIIFYTANQIGSYFAANVRKQLVKAAGELPIISVSQQPLDFGQNITMAGMSPSHTNIYRQALIGAKQAQTQYIALAEDDVLYSSEHFKYRPSPGKFAYNLGVWGIYTWKPTEFSWKGRRNLNSLICERELFIEAMEERFAQWPRDEEIDLGLWAEPGKYERQLGVTVRESETFWTNPPNIMFSHEKALSFRNLGIRKRVGELRATEIPIWGRVEDVMKYYRSENESKI